MWDIIDLFWKHIKGTSFLLGDPKWWVRPFACHWVAQLDKCTYLLGSRVKGWIPGLQPSWHLGFYSNIHMTWQNKKQNKISTIFMLSTNTWWKSLLKDLGSFRFWLPPTTSPNDKFLRLQIKYHSSLY